MAGSASPGRDGGCTSAARPGDRKRWLKQEVEELVVEAIRIGLDLEELVDAIETQWQKLGNMC